jgi:hypothetical protein
VPPAPTRGRAGAPAANQAVATPTPAAQPARGQLHVVEIKALDRAWVQVTVDGVIEYAETMPAGRTRRFEGRSIAVSSGNAEKVYLWIDGKDYGVLSTTNYIATVTVP